MLLWRKALLWWLWDVAESGCTALICCGPNPLDGCVWRAAWPGIAATVWCAGLAFSHRSTPGSWGEVSARPSVRLTASVIGVGRVVVGTG